jgi:hypothetical protein
VALGGIKAREEDLLLLFGRRGGVHSMAPAETAAAQWLRSVGRCCCDSSLGDRRCLIAGLGLCFGYPAIDLEEVAWLAEIAVRDRGEQLAETVDEDRSETTATPRSSWKPNRPKRLRRRLE